MVKEKPANQSNGVCEVPNTQWARLGDTAQTQERDVYKAGMTIMMTMNVEIEGQQNTLQIKSRINQPWFAVLYKTAINKSINVKVVLIMVYWI